MKPSMVAYGGGVATNDYKFLEFSNQEFRKFNKFPKKLLFNQSMIYFILKSLSVKIFYELFFLKIVRYAHLNNNLILLKLLYPSLKFKKEKFPSFYFSRISNEITCFLYMVSISSSE